MRSTLAAINRPVPPWAWPSSRRVPKSRLISWLLSELHMRHSVILMALRLQWGMGMRLMAAALVAFLAAPLSAATRLTYTIGDKAVSVEWPASAFPIRYQLDRRAASALTPEIV